MLECVTKQGLREKIIILLKGQREEKRLIKSKVICNRLFELSEVQKAGNILFYASFDGEVETFEMLKKAQQLGKKIGLPRIAADKTKITPVFVEYLDQDMEEGPYGIKQPKESCQKMPLNRLDAVIVPGIAFDKKNGRLGRGSGYYDRFLSLLSSDIPTIGLAFDFQYVDCLPCQEEHDISVSCVITN